MLTLYHNPKCSKSRATLALLEEHQADFNTVLYLQTPPSTDELDQLCQQLEMEPQALIRHKEPAFKALGLILSDTNISRQQWLAAMVENPMIIERPIVSNGTKAIIGRPPENVLTIVA